jgi:hypothetical protein
MESNEQNLEDLGTEIVKTYQYARDKEGQAFLKVEDASPAFGTLDFLLSIMEIESLREVFRPLPS